MRKVRTALDTAIRTKNIRSFSGRSGRPGTNTRGLPGNSAAGFSAVSVQGKRRAAALNYRKDAIAHLTAAQSRAFEKLPEKTQEELLLKAEKRIDRRISAGRYRSFETTAAVAARSAGTGKGRIQSPDSQVRTFSERVEDAGKTDLFSDTGQVNPAGIRGAEYAWLEDPVLLQYASHQESSDGRQEQGGRNDYYVKDRGADRSFAGLQRERYIRQQSQKIKGRQTPEKRKTVREIFSGTIPVAAGMTITGTGSRNAASGMGRKETGGKDNEKAGKKISHDYAKVLGRLVESQVRFTRQLENSRGSYRKQMTIQEMEEKEAKRVSRIVSFSLSRVKAAAGDLVRAARFLASKGKKYLILLLVPVMLLVMMVPLLLSSVSMTDEATANATAMELVEYALSWVGITKYIYGEGRAYETDWQDYTDCSGYVHGVFSHFGYEIGGDTIYMENSGTLVDTNSTEHALPGDIVLYFTGGIAPGNSTHVAIYIGKGQIVHCCGDPSNVSPATAGPGVLVGMADSDFRPYQIRRIIPEGASGGVGTGGHRVDPTNYSQADLELIWAIVGQEDNGSYEGALAVISSAMNRTDSPVWSYLGSTALQQLCAPGQYCYSIDRYWEARLGGNVPEYVKQAVYDCLKRGIRNHPYTCFRSTKGSETGPDAVQIGGNWFFGN